MAMKGLEMTRPQLMRRQVMCIASVFPLIACLPLQGSAQSSMSRAEAAQLYTAAGFVIANDQPVNRCGQRARPRVSFVDLDADKRPEALFIDEDARCYAPSGRYFAVLTKEGSRWRMLTSGTGSIQALPTRTAGWLDMRVSDAGCTRDFRFSGQTYAAVSGCAGEPLVTAPAARSSQAKAATVPGGGTATRCDRAAASRRAAERPNCNHHAAGWRSRPPPSRQAASRNAARPGAAAATTPVAPATRPAASSRSPI